MNNTFQTNRFPEKLLKITAIWQPRVIAEMNDYRFKDVRIEGNFVWHNHPETDETFIVLEDQLRIDFRDGDVCAGAGEMFILVVIVQPRMMSGFKSHSFCDRVRRLSDELTNSC